MTMAAPKVSIVVPVYNVERYLGACLDSLLRQTFGDFELICIDDGSTDGSPAILAEYAARDGRMKVVTQANAGLSAARNAGMDAAVGDYIYFIDSDDCIVDNAIERCVDICERDNLDQLVFGCSVKAESDVVDEKELLKKEAFYRLPESLCGEAMPGPSFLRKSIQGGGYFPSVPLRFMRREVLVKTGLRFPAGLLHEDEYFTPLLLLQSRRAEAIADRFYVRRMRDGSIMTVLVASDVVRHLAHTVLICVRMEKAARPMRLSREDRKALGLSLKRLYRHLVLSVVRGNMTVGDVWRNAQEIAGRCELSGHAGLRLRLAASVAAEKCIRRLRRLAKGLF